MYKRRIKRENLIKELFSDYLNDLIPKNYHSLIRFRVVKKLNGRFRYSNWCRRGKNFFLVVLNLDTLKDRIKNGYNNDFYSDRHNKLNFILGNKPLALRFVLLHELAHAYYDLTNPEYRHFGKQKSESMADNFAINELQ